MKSIEKQSNNLTHAQIKEIQQQQINGNVKMITGNLADDVKDPFYAKLYTGYQLPAYEAHLYHVILESKLFAPTTGERLSIPRIQKFDITNWGLVRERMNGYTVAILHNPTIDIKS